jgi:hypothetical protein
MMFNAYTKKRSMLGRLSDIQGIRELVQLTLVNLMTGCDMLYGVLMKMESFSILKF